MISLGFTIFFLVAAFALFVYSFVTMQQLKSSTEDWDAKKPRLITSWVVTISAMVALSLGLFFFYRYAQGQDFFHYFTLAMAFTAFGLSYTALMLTVMSK